LLGSKTCIKDSNLVRSHAMSTGRELRNFRRNLVPSYLG